MTTWNHIHILNASIEQLNNQQFIAACTVAYNAMKPKRAEAIEAALSVEGVLDLVLLDLFVGRESLRREVFKELVLAAEFCTSFQKWKMLRQLMTSQPDYFAELAEPVAKGLREDLHSLFSDRNKFAHGDLFVDASDKSVVIRYYEAGTKYTKVTESFLNDLIGRASRLREALFKLHSRFGTDLKTMQVPIS